MVIQIEDLRSGKRVPLSIEASYVAPWERNPAQVITFEGYHPDFKGADMPDVKLNGYQLAVDRGWVVGCRRTMQLPQGLFLNWEDLLHRIWPAREPFWRHNGEEISHPLVAVIPDGLPGAGMVVVRNTPQLTAATLDGDRLDQEAARRMHDGSMLRALGFAEVQNANDEGNQTGD